MEILNIDKICISKENRVVAVEINANSLAEIFIRDKQSILQRKKIAFSPFILLQKKELLPDNMGREFIFLKSLGLNPELSVMVKFTDIKQYQSAIDYLKSSTGFTPSAPNAPYRVINDLIQQFLIQEQIRLFRGMSFREVRRLQFDIETLLTEGFDFPNPERENDKIAVICLRDNTGWKETLVLDNAKGGEKELLEKFVALINERDPDVIEGYNIFRFDLPFIETKAKKHGVKLAIGRDGSSMTSKNSRMSFAERTINYTKFEIYGRHIADLYHMVQLYDISHRDLEDFNLKSVAKHFGVQAENRTYIEAENIPDVFNNNPQKLAAYCSDDVKECDNISQILSPSYFYQTQIVPLSYQNVIVRGNATKIDAMLIAEYINSGFSLPYPEEARNFEGALTDAFESGIFENIWHCDIRSLYPSILLAGKKSPSRDKNKSFLRLLQTLKDFRLSAKDLAKIEKDQEKKEFYEALQSTFKILINSFYGYLAFSQGTFNDYALAAAVTSTGRCILSTMTDYLRKIGAKVIEIDTDGIYFQPPPDEKSPDLMQKKIQSILPEGIEVELDNIYKAMFCYKSKNYALLMENGEFSVTGAALKSRGLEPFQRDYMSEFIKKLLLKDYEGIRQLKEKYRKMILNRELPLAKIAKTETLQDSLETYLKKINNGTGRRSAAYELASKSTRSYKQGDQVSYYVIGNKKKLSVVDNCRFLRDAPEIRDENVEYYLGKLEELDKKFSVFIPEKEKIMKQNDDLFV
ncbi:MAG TPA: DNA polymerase domain-containing protein [Victivallales bacterium]|nr:DNA polymerase domain-containing protein [Victivallales bacterium]HRR06391.1 DNA polymerase domain-containing protein [Victivallales bacterium]HRR27955.1 DNA polymerase domain-containing protein [Victivallales bacterium]HRU00611.1 DNA polymerase domain-containing protein [Victivallales bacterium]